MAAAKAPSPALEFLTDALKRNPKAAYADLKAKAEEKKLTVYPVMFGRAKLLLGLVKAKPRGTGRFAKASAAKRDDAAPTSTRSTVVRVNHRSRVVCIATAAAVARSTHSSLTRASPEPLPAPAAPAPRARPRGSRSPPLDAP